MTNKTLPCCEDVFGKLWKLHCSRITKVSGGQKLIKELLPDIIRIVTQVEGEK